MARPEKVEAAKDIAGRFKAAEAALLTDYRGLRVGDIAEVRNALRDANCEYKVLKNTLTRIAVREVGLDELVGMLEGPTAVAFCAGDAAAAAKALDEASKKFPVLVIKGGVLGGKVIGADEAKRLAQLEPREVQLATIARLMNSPIQQTANVLSALLRNLGSMLAQVVAQKEEEQPVAQTTGADEEAPAEEGTDATTPGGAEAGEERTDAAAGGDDGQDADGGAATTPVGDEAVPEEQPSTETLESDAEPGGAEAAEEAKEESKDAAEGGEAKEG
jgi:large subunit ribosomal protein L10